ncbi:MAG: phosphate acyltransferase PlsX [Planctomycetes bacterium]|nr:phosphate acyltransferase PlsX [Planctomycetota bacterium]
MRGPRIALDAMGGDNAPGAIVRGAVEALSGDEALHLVLVGDEQRILAELAGLDGDRDRIRIVHTTEVIEMGEAPIEALRRKKDSSILKLAKLAVAGEVDAVLSAGNTGAFAAACQLKMRSLPGVIRPGIAVVIPSFHGPFVLCDCGANIQAKAAHLHQYGTMASLYAEKVLGIERPRVALLSVGEESAKGTTLVKQARGLLEADDQINFVGNAEGRELFQDVCDVALCDGFVGNLMLKFVEGIAEGFLHTIRREADELIDDPSARKVFQVALQRVWSRHDYSEYGGAPLLGVQGACIICHGRSNERAIRNAVRAARRFLSQGLNEAIVERLGSEVSRTG